VRTKILQASENLGRQGDRETDNGMDLVYIRSLCTVGFPYVLSCHSSRDKAEDMWETDQLMHDDALVDLECLREDPR
jgi:hypothetical protein